MLLWVYYSDVCLGDDIASALCNMAVAACLKIWAWGILCLYLSYDNQLYDILLKTVSPPVAGPGVSDL